MLVEWTHAAAADLEEISDYLFQQNLEIAVDTTRRIYQSATELKQFPVVADQAAKRVHASWY